VKQEAWSLIAHLPARRVTDAEVDMHMTVFPAEACNTMSCRRLKNRLTLPASLSPDYPQGDDFVSNVIDFLQRLGQKADLRHAPRTALELALAESGIDPALREALLGADQRKLESLLGADTNVCAMSPGKKEDDEEEDEDEDDFEDDEDDEDDDEDDFDDEDEDEDDDEDEDEDDDEDDEDDEDEEEENSLTPRRPIRRVA
jgi:hypothetical protein